MDDKYCVSIKKLSHDNLERVAVDIESVRKGIVRWR